LGRGEKVGQDVLEKQLGKKGKKKTMDGGGDYSTGKEEAVHYLVPKGKDKRNPYSLLIRGKGRKTRSLISKRGRNFS